MGSDGSTVVPAVGNTNSTASRISPSLHWCFTFNNYIKGSDGSIKQLKDIFNINCKSYVFQEETGTCGTPHLQGYCCFKKKIRPTSLGLPKQIHWEKCNNIEASIAYCQKPETRTGDVFKFNLEGEPLDLLGDHKINYEDLRDDQKFIYNLFTSECPKTDRKIYWFWEALGNWGKTMLALAMIDNLGALMISGAAKDAINGVFSYIENNKKVPPIVIFDIPRTNEGHVSYQAIEQIKNGCIFNTKYETGMLRFKKPHILVFSNSLPETEKLSMDRWDIRNLRNLEKFIL